MKLQIWNEVEYDIWEDSKKEMSRLLNTMANIDGRDAVLKSKGLTGEEPIAQVDL